MPLLAKRFHGTFGPLVTIPSLQIPSSPRNNYFALLSSAPVDPVQKCWLASVSSYERQDARQLRIHPDTSLSYNRNHARLCLRHSRRRMAPLDDALRPDQSQPQSCQAPRPARPLGRGDRRRWLLPLVARQVLAAPTAFLASCIRHLIFRARDSPFLDEHTRPRTPVAH